jgi:hypothetical protein
MPILTRIGGEKSANALFRSRPGLPARKGPHGERWKTQASIRHPRLDDRPAVRHRDIGEHRVVASDHVDPGGVADAGEHQGRIDDVCEDNRDRAVNRKRAGKVGPVALHGLLELLERRRQRHPDALVVGR